MTDPVVVAAEGELKAKVEAANNAVQNDVVKIEGEVKADVAKVEAEPAKIEETVAVHSEGFIAELKAEWQRLEDRVISAPHRAQFLQELADFKAKFKHIFGG